ncbi:MAG: 23S rRNA (guanosine(2251)-2'-O)-methyltransferase RlmB [Candidatus Nanopelagicales bacterium]
MAGNSKRKGAVRKPGSKKGATVGSGGQRRRGLEAKGPTPKASDRVSHPANRRARAAEKAAEKSGRRTGGGGGGRGRAPVDVVVGRNPVVEALRARVPAEELIVLDFVDADDRVTEAVARAQAAGIPVRERPKRELDRLAGDAQHQGLVLRAAPFEYRDPGELVTAALAAAPTPRLVALDGITDPHNLGAIARSAVAFDARGLLVPSRRSASVTAAAWRSSAGAFARLPVAQASNLAQALANAQAEGFFVVGLAGGPAEDGAGARDGGAIPEAGKGRRQIVGDVASVAAHFADVPVILVVGSEGEGLSRLVAERADGLAAIGMPGPMESLNASVAAGIALFSFTTG